VTIMEVANRNAKGRESEMNREKIMIIGAGELGGIVLEFLARIHNICDIVVSDVNEDWGIRKTNSAILGASYMGLFPNITFEKVDLNNIDETASTLKRIHPSIIFNGTTLQSWWVVGRLPKEVHSEIYTGLGPWVPMHLALAYKLMKAVKVAGIEPFVVNSSFPDATNPILHKVGLAPTIGIGNMDLIIPPMRKTVGEKLGIPMKNVEVQMIGHHYHGYYFPRYGTGCEAPFFLKIFVNEEDVTNRFDIETLVSEIPKHARRPEGAKGQYVVASSSVKNIMAIFNDSGEITHAPGPCGLPGGYLVRLNRKGAEVVLPKGLTLQEAVRINEEAQRYDGIEAILEDGTVRFTDKSWSTLKRLIGYDCKQMTIDESDERARELREKFVAFAEKHGVHI
jgi:malate/lactate dehydrogenase